MRGVRLHALAQLAYEGIMARHLRPPPKVDAPVALSPMPAAAAGATATRMRTEMRLSPKVIRLPDERSEELLRSKSLKRPRKCDACKDTK